MLLTSGPWILYHLLLSGKTLKIPEGKYLASIILSVCCVEGWRAESRLAQGSCSDWCVLYCCAALVHIPIVLYKNVAIVVGAGQWPYNIQNLKGLLLDDIPASFMMD